MDILDDMGVSKLSAKVFFLKVNYSFNHMVLFKWVIPGHNKLNYRPAIAVMRALPNTFHAFLMHY